MLPSPEDITAGFENGTLDPAGFSHKDHVTVAHQLLARHDFLTAAKHYLDGLKELTEKAGVAHKVNMTVTLAFLSVISERMQKGSILTTGEFLEENMDLLSSNPLASWYSPERLNSDAARTGFLMPDHAPAPGASQSG